MSEQTRTQEELPDFPFPLFVENPQIVDYQLVHKLPLELFLRHEGHKVTIKRKKYVLSVSDSDYRPKDTLIVEVSTWMGISLNAVHYYGNLRIPSINFVDRHGSIIGGYGIPTTLREVELHRGITLQELTERPDRWKGYNVGDPVPGFDTIDDVVKRAGIVVARHFPGFKLKTEER